MNLILDSHPDFHCVDEDQFIIWLINAYVNMHFGKPCVSFKLPRLASMLPVIKSLPDRRILWCVRDPLDVVHSMVKLQLAYQDGKVSWAAHPGGGQMDILNGYWALDASNQERLKPHMARFSMISKKDPPDRNREECIFSSALCWTIKNEITARYDQEQISYHIVRYEELVTEPREQIAAILEYIGVPWNDDVLRHHELHEGRSIGNTSNTRKIDSSSVAQGAGQFSGEEIDLIKSVCDETAHKWHYTIPQPE